MCKNYRPISLANLDNKILAKILAARLFKVVRKLIHTDQTGFMKKRYSSDNTRKLFNIIYILLKKTHYVGCTVYIRCWKSLRPHWLPHWSFMFTTLQKYGFGNNFIQWIIMLYLKPTASVRTNDLCSKPFTLHRSAKQGFPVSGLLFNFAIEPLAEKIRSENNMKRVQIGSQTHKISLYCGDIILYLTDVESSLFHLNQIITHYGSLLGYKVNWEKCELMPLNKTCDISCVNNTIIKWKQTEITYLALKNYIKYLPKEGYKSHSNF